jgi:hypothetical protein
MGLRRCILVSCLRGSLTVRSDRGITLQRAAANFRSPFRGLKPRGCTLKRTPHPKALNPQVTSETRH